MDMYIVQKAPKGAIAKSATNAAITTELLSGI